jgi:hypothetical protein
MNEENIQENRFVGRKDYIKRRKILYLISLVNGHGMAGYQILLSFCALHTASKDCMVLVGAQLSHYPRHSKKKCLCRTLPLGFWPTFLTRGGSSPFQLATDLCRDVLTEG